MIGKRMACANLDKMACYETKDFRAFSITRFQLAHGESRPAVCSFTQPDGLLEIGLCLRGRWGISMPGQSPVVVTGSVGMVHMPGLFWQSRFEPGVACQGIGIAIPLESLAWYVGGSLHARKDVLALAEGRACRMAQFHSTSANALSLATAIYTTLWSDSWQNLLLEAKTLELLHHLLANPLSGENRNMRISRDDTIKLNNVREIILADLEVNMTITELARLAGLSPSKLKASFKCRFGATIHDFIRQAKLEYAKRMIESGKMNVTEAALSVGYNSLGHFSRIFKEAFGVLPKDACKYSVSFATLPVSNAA